MLDIKADVTIQGRQNLQVLVNGEVVRETGFHKNMVLDSWFSKIADGASGADSISTNGVAVGTGTAAVSPTQTGLSNFLVGKLGADGSLVHAVLPDVGNNSYYKTTRTYTFDEGAVLGNITEIATYIGGSTPISSTVAVTRALVLDGVGAISSISVGAGEQLRVIHELELGVSNLPVIINQDITTGGSTVNYTIEMRRVHKTDNFLAAFFFPNSSVNALMRPHASFSTFSFGVANGTPTTGEPAFYTATSVLSLVNPLKINSANTMSSIMGNVAGGTEGMLIASGGSAAFYGIKFTPKLPKTNLNKLTFNFSLEFTRV